MDMQVINLSNLNLLGLKPKFMVFPDSEFKVVLDQIPKDDTYVIVVQTDDSPAQKVLATGMLLDLVRQHSPSRVVVVHPWLSFSRQDKRFLGGEPLSILMLLDFYSALGATDLVAFDIHSVQWREPGLYEQKTSSGYMRIHNLNYVSSFYKEGYRILSPTGEDEPFLKPLREQGVQISYFKKEKYCKNCGKPLQECLCEGDVDKDVRIRSDEDFTGQKLLVVDDIIAGGGTMLSTVRQLVEAGASHIEVAATHGFFNDLKKANEILNTAARVAVSNTVSVPVDLEEKISVQDITPILEAYVKTLD